MSNQVEESKSESEQPSSTDLFSRVFKFPYLSTNMYEFFTSSLLGIPHADQPSAILEAYQAAISLYPDIKNLDNTQPIVGDSHEVSRSKLLNLWKFVQAKQHSPTIFPETLDTKYKWKLYYEQNPNRLIEIYERYVHNIESTSSVESQSIGSDRLTELPETVLEKLADPDSKKYKQAAELLSGENGTIFARNIMTQFANLGIGDIRDVQVSKNGDTKGSCLVIFEGREVVVPLYVKKTSIANRNRQTSEMQQDQYLKEKDFIEIWEKQNSEHFYKTSALPVCKDGELPSIWMIDLYKLGYIDMCKISDAVNTCAPLGLTHILQMFTTATTWMSQIEKFYTPSDIWGKGMVFTPDSPSRIRTFDYGNFDSKLSGVYRGRNFFDNNTLPPQIVPILSYSGFPDYPNPYLDLKFYRALERIKQEGNLSKWSDIADVFLNETINLPEALHDDSSYERYPKVVTADRVLRSLVNYMSEEDVKYAIDESYASDLPISAQSHSIALWICIKKGFSNRLICPVANDLGLSVDQTKNLIQDWNKINLVSVVGGIQSRLSDVLS